MIELLSAVSAWNLATGLIIAMLIVDRFTHFLDKVKGIVSSERTTPGKSYKDLEDKQRRCRDVARHVWYTDEGGEVLRKTRALYDWHNREDEDGVKIWYVRRDLKDSIGELSLNIARQTRVLERILDKDLPL